MTEDEPTKDLTKSLTDSKKLDWLMETMQRFLARDTNPLPPNYDARFTAMEERLAGRPAGRFAGQVS